MVDFARRGRLWIPEAPYINRIRSLELELASPAMGIAGVYGYEVGPDLAAGEIRASGEFGNLITDVGLDALGGTDITTLTSYFAVGTGTSTPAVGNTGLQTQVGSRVNAAGGFAEVTGYNATTDPANPFWYRRIPRVWGKGAFGGDVNLTELGVFSAASGGVCWSRQLFRDGAGLPTTVQVKADEELKVWYEYRLYPPMTDVVQTMVIKSVSVTITNRAVQINSGPAWGTGASGSRLLLNFGTWVANAPASNSTAFAAQEQALPSRTASLSGGDFAPTANWLAYVGGSRQRVLSAQFSPARANFAGQKVGMLGFGPCYTSSSIGLAPLISHLSPAPIKTTEEYLSLSVPIAWARTSNPTL